ncbi:hypothetical protein RZS08_64145, partial [Arthrospira platensis SPKY1]|nr:hypothetical protein [Arthrospira platensis SPKY1]
SWSRNRPPSENESGVAFTMPITRGRSGMAAAYRGRSHPGPPRSRLLAGGALSRLLAGDALSRLLAGVDRHVGQLAPALADVEAVADHPLGWDGEPDVAEPDL